MSTLTGRGRCVHSVIHSFISRLKKWPQGRKGEVSVTNVRFYRAIICDQLNDCTTQDERGLLMVWNQTPQQQTAALVVPLYYTGLTDSAKVSVEEGAHVTHTLARDHSITLNVSLAPMSLTWVLIK
jgi:hypothetical protein